MAHDASPTPTRPGRPVAHPLAGVLATLLGMAAAHVTAAFWNPAASPVLAVGSTVIDLTPTPVKELAVRTFGTYDKPLLVGGVVLATLALAALSGLLARRRPVAGVCLLLLLVLLAGLAAAVRPGAGPAEALPALAAGIIGTAALVWLTRLLRPSSGRPARTGPGSARPRQPGASRRGFLVAAGVVTAGAAVLGAAGTWVVRARTAVADFVLPRPARPAGDLPTGLEQRVPGITPLRTPNTDFYRVDTKLAVPVVDVAQWRLSIEGFTMNIRRTTVSAIALALALSLGACGAEDGTAPTAAQEPAAKTTPEEDMGEDMGGEERAEDASTGTFTVLTHHVVAGQLTPEELAGEHETLAGDMVSVTGSGEEFMVGDEQAAVLCGNIKTANATVYVVDTVLMP